jgi:hypothetical protein
VFAGEERLGEALAAAQAAEGRFERPAAG